MTSGRGNATRATMTGIRAMAEEEMAATSAAIRLLQARLTA